MRLVRTHVTEMRRGPLLLVSPIIAAADWDISNEQSRLKKPTRASIKYRERLRNLAYGEGGDSYQTMHYCCCEESRQPTYQMDLLGHFGQATHGMRKKKQQEDIDQGKATLQCKSEPSKNRGQSYALRSRARSDITRLAAASGGMVCTLLHEFSERKMLISDHHLPI